MWGRLLEQAFPGIRGFLRFDSSFLRTEPVFRTKISSPRPKVRYCKAVLSLRYHSCYCVFMNGDARPEFRRPALPVLIILDCKRTIQP